jgi:hypothetical protein
VAPLYDLKDFKVIYIFRSFEDTLNSMRNHYGANLFTQNYLPNSHYCSNHFNYKIQYQDPKYYYNTFNSIIQEYIKDKDSLILNYNDLNTSKSITQLNNFIQGNININIFQQ